MADETTWYVVADGGKARILTLDKGGMRTRQHFDSAGHGDTDEDPAAGPSQLKAPRTDPREQAKFAFARLIADRLNDAVRKSEVDQIVLAAPAHVLHDVREALDKEAGRRLTRSLSKDLTNIPDHDLASHFD